MSSPPPTQRRALIEAVIASTVGTTIEWYDFFLYGMMAADVFPKLFFPSFDDYAAQLLSFSTFTVGFIARPLGGVIFGRMGDRVGRKSTLVTTLLLMGISTLVIGFLPTYSQIGLLAPLALTVLRFIQGLGVGGEWGGAVLLALEYGHRGRRGFWASWPQAGVPLGLLLAGSVVHFYRGEEYYLDWGWRVPFYLSGLLIVVGLLIRVRILETPLFQQLQLQKKVTESPVLETIRKHWRQILLIAGSRISENASFYIFAIYIISYDKKVLHLDVNLAFFAVCTAAAFEFATIPFCGMLSDRFSRKRMYVLGSLLMILFAFPYYALLDTRNPALVIIATVFALAGGHAILYSVQASLIPELFGTRVRYTGASIGYQLASPIAGGLAPLIATWLVEQFPNQYWPLAVYLILISVVSLGCVRLLAETSRKDISIQE